MKKKHILTLVLFFIYSNSFCQLEKKTWLIGGSGNFRSSKDLSNLKTKRAELNCNIGYFIIDKLTIGLLPSYTHQSVKSSFQNNKSNFYAFGPFVRYYFLKNDSRLNVFSSIGYQFGKTTNSIGDAKINFFSSNVGCALFFNNIVALEFILGYSSINNKDAGKQNALVAILGFQFHLTK